MLQTFTEENRSIPILNHADPQKGLLSPHTHSTKNFTRRFLYIRNGTLPANARDNLLVPMQDVNIFSLYQRKCFAYSERIKTDLLHNTPFFS